MGRTPHGARCNFLHTLPSVDTKDPLETQQPPLPAAHLDQTAARDEGHEDKTDQNDSVPGHDTRIEQAEARTEQAEARTEQAKTRIEQAETRTEQAEARTEQAKTRTEQAEARTGTGRNAQ